MEMEKKNPTTSNRPHSNDRLLGSQVVREAIVLTSTHGGTVLVCSQEAIALVDHQGATARGDLKADVSSLLLEQRLTHIWTRQECSQVVYEGMRLILETRMEPAATMMAMLKNHSMRTTQCQDRNCWS